LNLEAPGDGSSKDRWQGRRRTFPTFHTWQLSIWFHRTFGNAQFKSGPFLPPRPPRDESVELRAELLRLQAEAAAIRESQSQTAAQVQILEAQLRQADADRSIWEQLAAVAELSKAELAQKLTEQQE